MNNTNINLFSTYFPLNNSSINKIFSSNCSPINNPKDKNINKKYNNNDYSSFAFFNSGKFKNRSDLNNSLISINKGQIFKKKNNIIPLIKNNHSDFSHIINKNNSCPDIEYKIESD